MGQIPYLPPNVKGWPGGTAWIDTSRLVTRFTFAEIIGEGQIPNQIDPSEEDEEMPEMMEMNLKLKPGKKTGKIPIRLGGVGGNLKVDFNATKLLPAKASPSETVEHLCKILLMVPLEAHEQTILVQRFEKMLSKSSTDESREKNLQKLIGTIMLLPSYQLH